MPDLMTVGGRVFKYPEQLEQPLRTLQYSGSRFLVSDPQ
jgi:hypothetical protein